MINALTIDVEDYYMVSAFSDIVRFEDWGAYESRVEKNTYRILDVLDEHNVKATFFILGWVAERCSELVRNIHASGHEVACHGYNHRLIYDLTQKQFKEDVRKAKGILEDIISAPVIGYRAASYSIVKETLWALDILIEEKFLYDSSIFPIHHDRYGLPGAERFPHVLKRNHGTLQEFRQIHVPSLRPERSDSGRRIPEAFSAADNQDRDEKHKQEREKTCYRLSPSLGNRPGPTTAEWPIVLENTALH